MAILKFIGCEGEAHVIKVPAGEAIAANDLVVMKTDGQAELLAVGELVFGQALNAVTAAGADLYVLRGDRMQFIMDNDNTGTTFAASHIGGRFDGGGATGAQVIDTSTIAQTGTGDTGQFLAIDYNPQGFGYDSDTSLGIFAVAERQ